MDSTTLIAGVSIYVLLMMGVIEWISYSILKTVHESYSLARFSFNSLWNVFSSCSVFFIWALFPIMYFSNLNQRQCCFQAVLCITFTLGGPILLISNLIGYYFKTIDYSTMCDCVLFTQILAKVLEFFHWILLLLMSIMGTFCLLVYLYLQTSDDRSLIPLESGEVVEEDMCAICLERMTREQEVSRVRRCGHIFHRECIENWISIKDQCPVCRIYV